MSRHWTIDELTDRLYGIREADRHLDSCRECEQRLEALQVRRAALAVAPEISPARLAAQRSAVSKRIESPSRYLPRWVPAGTAAACLLAVAMFLHRPTQIAPAIGDPRVVTTVGIAATAASDAQLFADIYNVEESAEPRAAAPMHALFQEGRQ
jgi:hypothetical protein